MAPTSRPHIPAAFTTYSAAIDPWSVTTPVTRPRADVMPVTATCSMIRTPPIRAPFA